MYAPTQGKEVTGYIYARTMSGCSTISDGEIGPLSRASSERASMASRHAFRLLGDAVAVVVAVGAALAAIDRACCSSRRGDFVTPLRCSPRVLSAAIPPAASRDCLAVPCVSSSGGGGRGGGGGTRSETSLPGEFKVGVLGDSMVADNPPPPQVGNPGRLPAGGAARKFRVEVNVTPSSDASFVSSEAPVVVLETDGRESKTTKRPARGGDGGRGDGDCGGDGGVDGDGGDGDGGAVAPPWADAEAGSPDTPPAGRGALEAGSRPCASTAYSAW